MSILIYLIVELLPPGQAAITLDNVATGLRPYGVSELDITWGRPSPRDHPEPGSITLTIALPTTIDPSTAIAWGTEVRIRAGINDPATSTVTEVKLGHGWIESWTRTPARHLGSYHYRLTLLDELGRAQAISVSDAPWPEEQSETRIARIKAPGETTPICAPQIINGLLGLTSHKLHARDVDNRSALELLRLCAWLSQHLQEGPDWRLCIIGSTNGEHETITIPAAQIEDTGRELDRRAAITELAVEGWWQSSADITSKTFTSPTIVSGQTSRATAATDAYLVGRETTIREWARAIIATSASATPMLPSGRILLDPPPPGISAVFDKHRRHRLAVWIPDAPPDVEATQYVTGGTLTITGLSPRLQLTLMPGSLYGIGRATWDTLRREPEPMTFAQAAALPRRRTIGDYRTYQSNTSPV